MGRRLTSPRLAVVLVALVAVVAEVACSSGKTRAIEDAKQLRDATGSAGSDATAVSGSGSASKTGDVQIRVEWQDVPVAARASPGKTPCNTPRLPSVTPTTTWGIPDALVVLDGAPPEPSTQIRVTLVECALGPRLTAGNALAIASGVDRPATVTITKRGTLAALPTLEAGTPMKIQLPIAGHAVTPMVEPAALYEIAAGVETAWFASATAAITDATGTVLVKDVPIGKHAVTAWLPPRGGQPGRHAEGEVTVEAADLAELVLQLE